MVYLYKCAFSQSEMFSDAFPTEEMFNGFVLAVKSSMVNKAAMKFDIGDADEVEDQDVQVNDIVDGFQYNQSTFTKAQFTAWLKGYMKRVVERLKELGKDDEYVKSFQSNATEAAKFILGKFDGFEFYLNENNDMDGALAMGYWVNTETDKGPTFLFFKDGMIRDKI